MTDEQWARFSEAASVVVGKSPAAFRRAVDALPADARQSFVAAILGEAADVLGGPAGHALQQVAELRDEAEVAADPESDAYAYPPVSDGETDA